MSMNTNHSSNNDHNHHNHSAGKAHSSHSVYTINVGGVLHTTTLSTLCRYPDSMIARMFTGAIPPSQSVDSSGHIFLDRDGALFTHILNFLRSGVLTLPERFRSLDSLQIEADYFGIEELVEALKAYRRGARPGTAVRDAGDCEAAGGPGAFAGHFLEIMEFEEASTFNRFYSLNEHQITSRWQQVTPKIGGLIVSGHQDVLRTLPIAYVPEHLSPEYPSVLVHSQHKMELFHHLSSRLWHLTHTGLSYGSDSEGSYIIHEYVWQKPPPD